MTLHNKWFIALLVLAVAVVYFSAHHLTSAIVRANAKAFVPHTLEFQTLARDEKTGNTVLTERRLVALRGDGSEAWISQYPANPTRPTARKLLRFNGQETVAFDGAGTKTSGFLTQRRIKDRLTKAQDAGPDCRFANESDAGTENMLGARVSVSLQNSKAVIDPNTGERIERRAMHWRALDYGCATLKVRHERIINGQWQSVLESVPLSFIPGEPDPKLFEESQYHGLLESRPSEVARKIAAQAGLEIGNCPNCIDPTRLEDIDKTYFAAQGLRP